MCNFWRLIVLPSFTLIIFQAGLHAQEDFSVAINSAIQALDAEERALEKNAVLIEAEEYSNGLRRMVASEKNPVMQIQRIAGPGAKGASGRSFMSFDFTRGQIPDSKKRMLYSIKNVQDGSYNSLYVSSKEAPDGKFAWGVDGSAQITAAAEGVPVTCAEGDFFHWYKLSTAGSSLPLSVIAGENHTLSVRPLSDTLTLDAFLLSKNLLDETTLCRFIGPKGTVGTREKAFFSRSAIAALPRRVPFNLPASYQIVTPAGTWGPAAFFVNISQQYDSIRIEIDQPASSNGAVLPWKDRNGKDMIRVNAIARTSRLIDINYKTKLAEKQAEWDLLNRLTCRNSEGKMICRRRVNPERLGLYGFFLDILSDRPGTYAAAVKVYGLRGKQKFAIGSGLALKVVTLPFSLPVASKDHGMYVKDKIRENTAAYTEKEFNVLIEHGVRVPVFRNLGEQFFAAPDADGNFPGDEDLINLTKSTMNLWKSKVVDLERGLDGRRPVREVDWLYDMLGTHAGGKEDLADPVFYSIENKGLSPEKISVLKARIRNLHSQISQTGVQTYIGLADEVSSRYGSPLVPKEGLVCYSSKAEKIARNCVNRIGKNDVSFIKSWQDNLAELYRVPGIPFYVTLRFLNLTSEADITQIEDAIGDSFKRAPAGVFDYSGGSFDWTFNAEQKEKIEQLNGNYPEVLRWDYHNNTGLGKKGFYWGHGNRVLNGVYLWNAPFSGALVWINHDADLTSSSRYIETYEVKTTAKTTEGPESGDDTAITTWNLYRHRTLYTIRGSSGDPVPTLRLKGYREGVTDFRVLQKLAACNPGSSVLNDVKALYPQETTADDSSDHSAESMSMRVEDLDLERIRLRAYQEILQLGCS